MTLAALQQMHTGSLMKRRAALLACEESFAVSDRDGLPNTENGRIEFKNTPQWQQAYEDIKSVLATREHIPNKQERKAIRQAKAKQSK